MAASSYIDAVQKLYIAYYGRPADVLGLDYWTKQIDAAGGKIEDVVNAFGNSAEAQSIYGSVGTATAINNVYKNILGRDADATGLTYYASEINSGKLTLAQLAQAVIAGVTGDDVAVVTNKLAVAKSFTTAMDTGAEIASYSGEAAAQAARTFLSTVDGTDASVTAANAGIDAAIAGLQGAGNNFSLTIGQDNLIGTGGNDVFTSLVVQDNGGGTASTLENVDVVDGGIGNDVLNVTLQANAAPTLKNIETVNVRFTGANTLDLANSTGISSVKVANSTAAGKVDNLAAIGTLTIADQTQNVAFDNSTAATLNITASNVATAAGAAITVDLGNAAAAAAKTANLNLTNAKIDVNSTTADAIETLTVAASGTNVLTLTDSGNDVKTVTVTGAGSLDLTGVALTGALTSFDASASTGAIKVDIQSTAKAAVKTGAGADVIDMDTAVVADTTVAAGAGNDAVYVGALLGSFKSVDGGEGTDIINITNGNNVTVANVAKVSNFEVLDVSGGQGTYDLSLKSFTKVQIDEAINGALAGALILNKAAAGFTLDVISEAKTNADFALAQAQTIALADVTGSSDTVNLNVSIKDGNNDAAADGNVTFTTSTTIAGVENINIGSTVVTADTDVKANAYSTTFTDLVAADVKTLTLTGDSDIVFTALTNAGNTLTKVNAGAATGDITLDVSAILTTVAYTGSEGVDTYTATNGGSVYGGKGNDAITLTAAGAGGKADTIILKAATDASAKDADGSGKIDAYTIETITNFVTKTTAAATEESDVIDLTSFGFAGYASTAVNKGALAASVEGGTFDASITDFFADAAGDRGVAFGTSGAATYIFVDANKDGNFTVADDLVIKLAGVTNFASADFAF